MTILKTSFLVVLFTAATAGAGPKITITPAKPHLGDAVLVTVKNASHEPHGTALDRALQFTRTKIGYQAVFAIPLELHADDITLAIADTKPITIALAPRDFPDVNVEVDDELANPPPAERARVDEDNAAIIAACVKSSDVPLARAFKRPPGEVTSGFGVWRTFNDGHRSQHLGADFFARESSPVRAVNAGTVTLVRDTYLAGTVVVVSHGRGLASAYFHLAAATVTEGDTVVAGDLVGKAGHTGRATGPHLHLGIHVPGGFVDPVTFFKLPIAASPSMATAAR